MSKNEDKKLSIFDKPEKITGNTISQRSEAMKAVSDFKCETEEHRKARYALFKNMDRYERAVKTIKNMLEEPSEEMKEYQKEVRELLKKHGAEEIHHPEVGSYLDPKTVDDKTAYRKAKDKLEKKHKDTIDEDEKRRERNEALGKMEIDDVPDPFTTDSDNFPNSVTPGQLASIAFMINDPNDIKEEVEDKESEEEDSAPKRTKKSKSKSK